MTHRHIRIAATLVVVGLAFAGLLYSSLRGGTEYFLHVDEVLPNRQAWEGKPLQLHGYVIPGSIYRKTDSLEYRFQVQNSPIRSSAAKGGIINASYTGIVPDTFKGEAEVVLRGRLSADGFLVDPNGVVAKCPSKYEEQAAAAGS